MDKMLMSVMQRRSDKDFYASPSWTSALTKHWNIKLKASLKRLCIWMGLLRIYIICGWVFHFLSKPSLSGDCDRCQEQTFEFIGDGIHAVNALVFMGFKTLFKLQIVCHYSSSFVKPATHRLHSWNWALIYTHTVIYQSL